MLKSLRYLRWQEWALMVLTGVLIVLKVRLDLLLPEYMATITELTQQSGHPLSEVLQAGGKMLACALGSLALAVGVGLSSALVAARYSATLRSKLYRRVLAFSPAEINRFSTPSLITRSTNDITQMQMFMVMGLQILIQAPLMAAMAMGRITNKSWAWSALTAAVVLSVTLVLVGIMLYALPRFTRIQSLLDNLSRVVRENLSGILVVRAYNAEGYQQAKFERANRELATTQRQAGVAMSFMYPTIGLAMNGLTLGIYWVGAILINDVPVKTASDVQARVALFADMIVFMSYAMQVIMSFLMLIFIFVLMPRAVVSARRVCEVLDTPLSIVDGQLSGEELVERERAVGGGDKRGCVEFRDVTFTYPQGGSPAIEHVSFVARPGQTVALIGSTGAGKSTIISLIPRLYDASAGQVLVDGIDVREYSEEALRAKIGYVPQKAFLFSGSVRSNLAYGLAATKEADEEELWWAAGVAQARDFVEALTADAEQEGQLDSPVAQAGTNFSGGQRQRLAIARAIAKRPEILIFDDSFSALDYATDRRLRAELRASASEATKIIVAQRIGTILDADEILVIDEGKVVGRGRHRDLLETCEVYREIALSQLSEKELEQ